VNKLESMLKRNLKIEHQLICITDMPDGVNCETIELWDDLADLGGCYRRLKLFSSEMETLLGMRFAWIDLDCVITGDVTDIFTLQEPFVINGYGQGRYSDQKYNGSLVIMDSGIHHNVWDDFDSEESPKLMRIMNEQSRLIGSDQAWISYKIESAKVVGADEGVYNARLIGDRLPDNCKIVFFSGMRDPSISKHRWIAEHYH
jgi:hypothetical protein